MSVLRSPGRALLGLAARRPEPPAAVGGELHAAVRRRLRAAPTEPLLFGRFACVLLDAGSEQVTIDVRNGKLSCVPGAPRKPTTTVRGALPILLDVVEGARPAAARSWSGRSPSAATSGCRSPSTAVRARGPARPVAAARWGATGRRHGTIGAGPSDEPVSSSCTASADAASAAAAVGAGADHRVHAPDLPGFGDTPSRARL